MVWLENFSVIPSRFVAQSVVGRSFDAAGTPESVGFGVRSVTGYSYVRAAEITGDGSGAFLIALRTRGWRCFRRRAQRFDSCESVFCEIFLLHIRRVFGLDVSPGEAIGEAARTLIEGGDALRDWLAAIPCPCGDSEASEICHRALLQLIG